jgi:hypothetical protein
VIAPALERAVRADSRPGFRWRMHAPAQPAEVAGGRGNPLMVERQESPAAAVLCPQPSAPFVQQLETSSLKRGQQQNEGHGHRFALPAAVAVPAAAGQLAPLPPPALMALASLALQPAEARQDNEGKSPDVALLADEGAGLAAAEPVAAGQEVAAAGAAVGMGRMAKLDDCTPREKVTVVDVPRDCLSNREFKDQLRQLHAQLLGWHPGDACPAVRELRTHSPQGGCKGALARASEGTPLLKYISKPCTCPDGKHPLRVEYRVMQGTLLFARAPAPEPACPEPASLARTADLRMFWQPAARNRFLRHVTLFCAAEDMKFYMIALVFDASALAGRAALGAGARAVVSGRPAARFTDAPSRVVSWNDYLAERGIM